MTGSLGTGGYYYTDDASDADLADTLIINGTGSITGNITMGGDTDTLNLSPNGSIGGYVNF